MSFINIAIALINGSIGAYVFSRNAKDAIHRYFFIFTLGIVFWTASLVLLSETQRFIFAVPALWGGELIALGFFLFAFFFPENRPRPKYLLPFLLPWLLIFTLTPSRLFIASVTFDVHGYLHPENGFLFPLWAGIIALYLVAGIAILVRNYRRLTGVYRVQLRYVIAGTGTFVIAGFIFDILLPAFKIFSFNLLGPVFSVVFIECIAYAIIQHQFMDIRVVIKRSVVYLLTLGTIGLFFFSLEFILEKSIYNDEWVDIASAMVGGLLFLRLRSFFEKVTEPIFFRNEYQYSEAVHELGETLSSTIDLNNLLTALRKILMKTIKPSKIIFSNEPHVDLQLFDAASGIEPVFFEKEERGIAAIIPLVANEKAMAYIALGPKLSDDIFRSKDMEFLKVLSHQAGIAFVNAELYEAVREHSEELEKKVEERTEKIREMHESQSKFLADISHELQTPLAILKGNAEILANEKSEKTKTPVRVIKTTLERMTRLIENLLAAARLDFGKDALQKTPLAIEEIIEEVAGDCLILAEHKQVALSAKSDHTVVIGDRDKLKEVILNLISNALKHTASGGKIFIYGVKNDHQIKINVEDTGTGIPPENISRIFERFYRIDGGNIPGMGIGLHLCRQIIEAHGGTIEVKSEMGKGSCFTVILPLVAP